MNDRDAMVVIPCAHAWLALHGYTWTGDIQALAERIQETAEEFVADLDHPDADDPHLSER